MKFYDPCPYCGKLGWFISGAPFDLEHRLYSCRYCKANETIMPCPRCQGGRVIIYPIFGKHDQWCRACGWTATVLA